MIKIKKNLCYDLLLAMYFFLLLYHEISNSIFVKLAWLVVMSSCAGLGLIRIKKLSDFDVVSFVVIFLFTGLLNKLIIGNINITNYVYMIMSLGVSFFLMQPIFRLKTIYMTIVFMSLVVIIAFIRKGFSVSFFGDLSNNYMSVIFIIPISIYYSEIERQHEKIRILPVVLLLFVSCLAQGRSGIIVSGFILFAVLFFYIKQNKDAVESKSKILYVLGWVILIVTAIVLVIVNLDSVMNSSFLWRFKKYGTYGTGRKGIWGEYISKTFETPKYLFFGTDFNILFYMIRYRNNLHNSYLMIHAYNGIIMLLFILNQIIKRCKNIYKEKKWISLVCIIAFCARGFSDKIFWGNATAMPLLFYFIFQRSENKKRMTKISRDR